MNKKFLKIKKACMLVSIWRSKLVKQACPPTCLSMKQMRRGFSLIEVLVALLILSFGITAIAVLMLNNIKGLQTAKNQIIASMLAQEGVEIVRNFKDNGGLDADHDGCTYTSVSTCAYLIADYAYDPDGHPKKIALPADKDRLDLKNGFYEHGNGTATKFYRQINFSIEDGPYVDPAVDISNRVVRVMVFVTWNNKGFTVAAGLSPVNATNCNVANQCVYIESSMPDPII